MSDMRYMQKGWTIVGYSFDAANYCDGDCVLRAVPHILPSDFDLPTEEALDRCAEAAGINRQDESSFDSGDFPKVIFASQVSGDDPGDTCTVCGIEL